VKAAILRRISIGALTATAVAMPFSVQLCHWSFLSFVLCWTIEGDWNAKWQLIKNNALVWLLPSFFLLHLIATLYTTNEPSGWFQIEKKAAFLLMPVTIASMPPMNRKELRFVVEVFIASCTIATLYCVGNAAWVALSDLPLNNFGDATLAEFERLNPGTPRVWMAFSYISLASGIQMHPTYFGLYLITCLLLILFFFKRSEVTQKERTAGRLLFVFFLLFIFFLSSRIITLSAIAVSILALAIKLPRPTWGRAIKFQAAMVLGFLLLVYINPVSRYRELQEPATASLVNLPSHTDTSIEIRLSLLKLSLIAGSSGNSWFGSGTGSAEDRLKVAAEQNGISNVLGSHDPHNQFIYTFLDLGWAGLILLAAVIFVPMRTAWNKKSILYLGFASVFFCVCMTESALELQKGIVLFTFFGSLLLFHEMTPDASHRHD
jgi:O-antigen ligase